MTKRAGDRWFLDMLDGQISKVRLSEKCKYHEAVRVWVDWRNGHIPFYSNVGDMPLATAMGYEYLARTYGRNDIASHRQTHDELVAVHQRLIGMIN